MKAATGVHVGRSALLLTWMLATACAESPPVTPAQATVERAIVEEDDVWSMVPAEADLVLVADLAKLRQSPWTGETFDKVSGTNASPGDPVVDQLRTMDRVMFAKVPTLHDGASILALQGKVDREVMRKGFIARGEGVQRSTYRGAELLVRGDEALAFVGRRWVVSGSVLAVRAAVDCNFGVAATIETESWLKHLRRQLDSRRPSVPPVLSLYVRLLPATRATLMQEMGEGEFLEELGARVDLDVDLDAAAIGVVRTDAQATDLSARFADRVRELRGRPIVSAFGLGSVVDSLRFVAKDNQVLGTLHVSQKERADISARMAMVAEILAKMRGEKMVEKNADARSNQDKEKP